MTLFFPPLRCKHLPLPASLPVQRKLEPPSLDPAEEPLLWEGLTLNKCILVASVVALLSVTFQVLQAGSRTEGDGVGSPCCHLLPPPAPSPLLSSSAVLQGGSQPRPAGPSTTSPSRWVRMLQAVPIPQIQPETGPRPRVGVALGPRVWDVTPEQPRPLLTVTRPSPLPEVVSAKEEEVQEVVTAQPAQPESSMFQGDDGDDDGDDIGDDDSDADSNLAEPWIFKKWFGRSAPEDGDEEPTDVPEVSPAAVEVKKSREKKPEKKEEKAREGRAAQAERSSRRETRAKDRAPGEKPSRAPRAPREPEQQPQKKRGREGKESRRERDEPRKEGWKGRPGRADGGGESPKRDWRQQKGRKPWEPAAAPGKDGTARPREGKRRD
ncbi:LOW QUALITY PROTEIN: hypothetical protein QYF61_011793 [Mycteria americana]|uniref:Junctional sarcoplasmic reticulum protein 1 n=1 Tax=Mycteria americana TaxID=33587 RepID=A0AAN7MD45_MYCAM|nr:LOW QUALITY PROTEIN: hypothetical protein QYF61_011793 [Mycteria americana]